MRALGSSAWLLGAALALPGTAPGGIPAAAEVAPVSSVASGTSDDAGPRHVEARPGAAWARSSDELRAMIADPSGPRVIDLAPGVHRGDVTVKRPVSIRGMAGAVLEGSGTATVLTIDAADVTVENVTLRRSGHRHTAEDAGIKASGDRVRIADVAVEDTLFGISLAACRACEVERARITGPADDAEMRGDGVKLWEAHGSRVSRSVIDRSRDLVVWYTRRARLEGNVVRGGRYGAHFMFAHDGTAERNRFEGNVVGVFVMYSARVALRRNLLSGARGAAGMGLGLKDSDAVTVEGNWIVANTAGAYLDNTPRNPDDAVFVRGNVIALNDVALRLHSSEKGLHVLGNDVRSNGRTVEVDGGGGALGVDARGNHFTEYEGYDLDGDAIGDVPHEVKALSSELGDRRPALKFFAGTAAMGLVDAVSRAVPVFASQKVLVDPAPLTRPPVVEAP